MLLEVSSGNFYVFQKFSYFFPKLLRIFFNSKDPSENLWSEAPTENQPEVILGASLRILSKLLLEVLP